MQSSAFAVKTSSTWVVAVLLDARIDILRHKSSRRCRHLGDSHHQPPPTTTPVTPQPLPHPTHPSHRHCHTDDGQTLLRRNGYVLLICDRQLDSFWRTISP